MLRRKGVSTSFHCTAWSAPQLTSAQLYGFLARCRHSHIIHPLFFSYSHHHAPTQATLPTRTGQALRLRELDDSLVLYPQGILRSDETIVLQISVVRLEFHNDVPSLKLDTDVLGLPCHCHGTIHVVCVSRTLPGWYQDTAPFSLMPPNPQRKDR